MNIHVKLNRVPELSNNYFKKVSNNSLFIARKIFYPTIKPIYNPNNKTISHKE